VPNLKLLFSATAEPFCLLSVGNKKAEITEDEYSFLKKGKNISNLELRRGHHRNKNNV